MQAKWDKTTDRHERDGSITQYSCHGITDAAAARRIKAARVYELSAHGNDKVSTGDNQIAKSGVKTHLTGTVARPKARATSKALPPMRSTYISAVSHPQIRPPRLASSSAPQRATPAPLNALGKPLARKCQHREVDLLPSAIDSRRDTLRADVSTMRIEQEERVFLRVQAR